MNIYMNELLNSELFQRSMKKMVREVVEEMVEEGKTGKLHQEIARIALDAMREDAIQNGPVASAIRK